MEGNRDMLPERKGGSQTNKSRNIHFVIGCCRLLPAAYLYSPVDPQQNHTNEHPPPAAIKKELRMNAHGLVYVYTASKSAGIEVGSFKWENPKRCKTYYREKHKYSPYNIPLNPKEFPNLKYFKVYIV